jgi:hypothetical protein
MLTTLDWVTRFLWYVARAARRKFYFCNLGARSVDLSYHWVSADLKNKKVAPCICRKHNGRATKNLQKVFYFCNLGALCTDLSYHWVSADLKNTKVEPCICRKHNGRETKNLQKVFFSVFFRKPEPRGHVFCLCKTAHFLIKRCTFSAREKFFAPGRSRTPGQDFWRRSLTNYLSRW